MSTGPSTPIVTVVGKSDSGKTTFLEKLIAELTSRGWRIATAKHHAHSEEDVDVAGKDSWRHRQAGAVMSIVASATQVGVVRQTPSALSLDEVVAAEVGPDIDLVLAEGYKSQPHNAIEVSRIARSATLVLEPGEPIAIVTDNPALASYGVPLFGLDDAAPVSDLIESRLLKGGRHGD